MPSQKPLFYFDNEEEEFDEEEFDDADDEFAGALDSDDDNDGKDFSCDHNLPSRGLDDSTKVYLLHQLDLNGGLEKCTRSSKLLDSICTNSPEQLGQKGSQRRKRVQWLVDSWKKKSDSEFRKIRSKLLAQEAKKQPAKEATKRTASVPITVPKPPTVSKSTVPTLSTQKPTTPISTSCFTFNPTKMFRRKKKTEKSK